MVEELIGDGPLRGPSHGGGLYGGGFLWRSITWRMLYGEERHGASQEPVGGAIVALLANVVVGVCLLYPSQPSEAFSQAGFSLSMVDEGHMKEGQKRRVRWRRLIVGKSSPGLAQEDNHIGSAR